MLRQESIIVSIQFHPKGYSANCLCCFGHLARHGSTVEEKCSFNFVLTYKLATCWSLVQSSHIEMQYCHLLHCLARARILADTPVKKTRTPATKMDAISMNNLCKSIVT
ncbi:hypothetical protein GHT06_014533 [Daphnia sinensis]|uniref:Uncharacterized protein n=1 Tax=Daphnia sinensis TaxID=1820382 RepID=A0AAD5L7W6_9CRUS|nr:hypothetical protein GHT06_014533 [Daphnia sinensis]